LILASFGLSGAGFRLWRNSALAILTGGDKNSAPIIKAILFPALLCLGATAVLRADIIFLTPSAAIGGTPTFLNSDYKGEFNFGGDYVAGNLFNQQTGDVNVTTQEGNVWFGTDLAGAGPLNRWVTIDLGAAYSLSHIEVFNSNQTDRGTGEISLYGANAIEVDADPFNGYTLTSPTLLINNASLTYAAGVNPIAGNIHTVGNQSAFRYLQIWTLSYANTPLSPTGTGLSELRVFEAQPVPEPGTWAAAGLLAGGAAFMRWRRSFGRR
jgi:hypothetical protein